jgi:hypothetical protein
VRAPVSAHRPDAGLVEQDGHDLGDELAQLCLVGPQLTVPGADVGGQAAQLGAEDLLGDRLAGVHPQGAAAGGLAWRAQAAQCLAQAVGRAQDQRLERVDRGGACHGCLGPGSQQDPQRLADAVRSWLGELIGSQGLAGGPGCISGIGLAAGPLAGPLRRPARDCCGGRRSGQNPAR